MELYYAAAEWMYASQENFDQTLEWFAEWNEENGVTSTYEELEIMCNVSGPFTLEEAYEIVSTESPISGMSDFHYYSYDPLLFYVSLGNYSEEDAEIFSQSQYYDTSIIEGIYANKN